MNVRRIKLNLSAVALVEPSWWEGSLIPVTEEDILVGVVFITCPDCAGVGLIPWHLEGIIEDCVLCKGSGKYPVGL